MSSGTSTLVLLVRHGQAENTHPDGDAARRLTPAGRQAFQAHAGLVAATARLDRVLTSPYARAKETAQLLAAACGLAEPELRADLGAAEASPTTIMRLCETEPGPLAVALVGHNPTLTDAAALLLDLDERQIRFSPGTAAALTRGEDGTGWRLLWVAEPGAPLRPRF